MELDGNVPRFSENEELLFAQALARDLATASLERMAAIIEEMELILTKPGTGRGPVPGTRNIEPDF